MTNKTEMCVFQRQDDTDKKLGFCSGPLKHRFSRLHMCLFGFGKKTRGKKVSGRK